MLKKIYFSKVLPILISALFLIKSDAVLAVTIPNPLGYENLTEFLYAVINFLFLISLPIGALMIVIAAFWLLISAGEPEKIKKARDIIIWTLAGILVLFLSKALIALFTGIIKGNK